MNGNNGMGLLSVVGVVFVTLKLLGVSAVAAWSWWLVLLPFWGGIVLAVIIGGIAIVVIAFTEAMQERERNRRVAARSTIRTAHSAAQW